MYIHIENNVDYENLRYEVSEAIATITIDRPRIVNDLNQAKRLEEQHTMIMTITRIRTSPRNAKTLLG